MGHIIVFVLPLADHAAVFTLAGGGKARAGEVVFAACGPGNQRRGEQCRTHGNEGGQRLGGAAENPQIGHDREHRGNQHGTYPHGVDVVKVCALEFNAFGREAQRFVDDEIRHHGHEPGYRDV